MALFDELTSAELGRVQRALNEPDRPEYFNAGTGSMTPVSDDFLAVTTLASISAKQSAVNWLTLIAASGLQRDPLAESIYQEALDAEREMLDGMKANIDLIIQPLTDFQQTFPGDARFRTVEEVSMILDDAMLAVDGIVGLRDSVHHRVIMADACERRYIDQSGISEARKRQAASWVLSLSIPAVM